MYVNLEALTGRSKQECEFTPDTSIPLVASRKVKQLRGNVVHSWRLSCTTSSTSSLSTVVSQPLVWGVWLLWVTLDSASGCFHCCLWWPLTYAVESWREPLGCCRPPSCFLTSFPSLCSCTSPQSTCPLLLSSVPVGSPSCDRDVTVYVFIIKQPSLPTPFILFSYGPFNCISFHKFSQQFLAFSLCSPDLISALLVLSTVYIFINISLNGLMTCVLGKKYRRWIEHCF